jgi:hypothetical protein
MQSDSTEPPAPQISRQKRQPQKPDLAKYPVEVLEAVLVILASELDRENKPGPAKRNEKPVNGQ